MKKEKIIVAIKTVSDFEQGYISSLMSKFGLNITERRRGWIVFEKKVGLIKAAKILTFLRKSHYEFYIKGEEA